MLSDFHFHHIGYAVKDVDKTSAYYTSEGWNVSETVIDTIQNAKIAFLSKEGEPLIELVGSVDEKSPINKTLEKSGISPYHICYEVNDIFEAVIQMRKKRFIPLFNPVKAVALNDRLICYLYNKDVGLIELLNK